MAPPPAHELIWGPAELCGASSQGVLYYPVLQMWHREAKCLGGGHTAGQRREEPSQVSIPNSLPCPTPPVFPTPHSFVHHLHGFCQAHKMPVLVCFFGFCLFFFYLLSFFNVFELIAKGMVFIPVTISRIPFPATGHPENQGGENTISVKFRVAAAAQRASLSPCWKGGLACLETCSRRISTKLTLSL